MREPPTRRRVLHGLGVTLTAGVAGCSSGDDESTAEPAADAATHAHSNTPGTRQDRTDTSAPEDGSSADGTTSPARFNMAYDDEELHATLTDAVDVPEDEVLVGYHLLDGPLPFTTQVYHAPDDATPQATETYDTQDIEAVSLLPADPEPLETLETDARDVHYGTTPVGEPLAVTLVGQYDDDLTWTAYRRSGHPFDGHDGDIAVECYCSGEVYDVPAGGTWARVIQVTPTDAVETGTGTVVSWTSGPWDA